MKPLAVPTASITTTPPVSSTPTRVSVNAGRTWSISQPPGGAVANFTRPYTPSAKAGYSGGASRVSSR